MSVPVQPYGSFPAAPRPLRGGMGVVSFVLGLVAAFGLVVYVVWLAVGAVAGIGGISGIDGMGAATDKVSGSAAGSMGHGSIEPGLIEHGSMQPEDIAPRAPAPSTAAPLAPPTPSDATLAFDELWISGNGDTIVAGMPMLGISPLTGESMIQVPVTLTNNGERDWKPEFTGFAGTLNHAPVAESAEGDWMYREPIVPHTSVTLNKVFVGRPGEFALRISTPDGVASFAGRI